MIVAGIGGDRKGITFSGRQKGYICDSAHI